MIWSESNQKPFSWINSSKGDTSLKERSVDIKQDFFFYCLVTSHKSGTLSSLWSILSLMADNDWHQGRCRQVWLLVLWDKRNLFCIVPCPQSHMCTTQICVYMQCTAALFSQRLLLCTVESHFCQRKKAGEAWPLCHCRWRFERFSLSAGQQFELPFNLRQISFICGFEEEETLDERPWNLIWLVIIGHRLHLREQFNIQDYV